MTISKELLAILACPQCKGELRLSEREDALECGACRLRYRILEGIPVLLAEEAERLG
jgi:uncharacterized protein YbaR (Trm112 family)